MDKRLKPEGDPFSRLVQEMQINGYNKAVDIEIGTVIAAPPEIIVRLDSSPIDIDNDDLVIAEHLTQHTRVVSLREQGIEQAEIEFIDELKAGDRIIVACLDEQMRYVILDRARWYDGANS